MVRTPATLILVTAALMLTMPLASAGGEIVSTPLHLDHAIACAEAGGTYDPGLDKCCPRGKTCNFAEGTDL